MTRETIIKLALKYLVKMQIEEGSVGFAVDNDPDHDVCWDDVLTWLETQPSDDCISRKEVLSLQTKYAEEIGATTFWKMRDDIQKLQPSTSQRPRGEWIKVDDEEPIAYDCSECGSMMSKKYNYCPNCGADMRGKEK